MQPQPFQYRHRLGGQQRRAFNRAVAASAIRQNSTTLTTKLPLEPPKQGWPFTFDTATKLFNITDGLGQGSLAGFLIGAQLLKFRPFSSAGQTRLFRYRKKLPVEAFEQAFTQAFKQPPLKFTPLELINYFARERRIRAGKEPAFGLTVFQDDLYQLATGKPPAKSKTVNEKLLEVCRLIAEQLCAHYSDWKAVNSDIPSALRCIDTALASAGFNFPQLESAARTLGELTPKDSSIDYDDSLLQASESDIFSEHAIHSLVAQKLHWLRRHGQSIDAKAVQEQITTSSNNALSWLFGTGLHYWQNTPLAQIQADYELNEAQRPQLALVQRLARSIARDPLFGEKNYAKFRTTVGGKLDSWIANYLNRLELLDTILNSIAPQSLAVPDALFHPNHAYLFSGLGVTPTELRELLAQIFRQKDDAVAALAVLYGKQDRLPTPKDIACLEAYSNLLNCVYGMLQMLTNRLRQERESVPAEQQAALKALGFTLPDWLKELPAVPRLSGGVADHRREVAEAATRFNRIQSALQRQVRQLVGQVQWSQIVNASIIKERQHLARHPQADEFNYTELAQRHLLQQYLNVLGRSDYRPLKQAALERLLALNLFTVEKPKGIAAKDVNGYIHRQQRKLLNKLLFNQQGKVYRSPFSKARHAPLKLYREKLGQIDLIAWLLADLQMLQKAHNASPQCRMKERLALQNLLVRLQLTALPAQISTRELDMETLAELKVPAQLQPLLTLDQISAETCIKLINLYFSELRGLQVMLFRDEYMVRTRFQLIGRNEVIYSPKRRTGQWYWRPPALLWRSHKPLGQWLQKMSPTPLAELKLPDLKPLYQENKSEWRRGQSPIGELLRQAPHDWYLDLGLADQTGCPPVEGVKVSKKGLATPKRFNHAVRLIGPCSRKAGLDRLLTDPELSLGDYTLLIEQQFRQQISWENETPNIHLEPAEMRVEVALPITEQPPSPSNQFPLGSTLIGIDLGEAGIGYAVLDAKTFDVLAAAPIPIRSIRNLIRSVRHHRNKKQPRQKFSQRHSTALAKLRENVIGDIAHWIDSLCAYYSGFPVLESSVRNLASGSKQLQLVYDRLLNLYVYSSTDAHKAARRQHWAGSENWQHPFLTYEREKNGKPVREPVRLYPGVQVHPAGTSQTCSCCGRNPYDALDQGFSAAKRLRTDANGILKLGECKLKFVSQTSPTLTGQQRKRLEKQQRRQKVRPAFKYPAAEQSFSLVEARRQLARQLRRPPESTRSRDTTQSWYACAFADCGHQMHADVNAAINIARKWLKRYKVKSDD